MRYIFITLLFACVSVSCIYTKEVRSNSLPHHEFALVVPSSEDDYDSVLHRLLHDVIEYLDASHILPKGFPKPCIIASAPLEDNPSIKIISCIPSTVEDGKENGILLDADGHFIQFSVLTCPDTRVYLFEIYLFKRLPPRLQQAPKENRVRFGVHLPWLEDTKYDTLFPVLEKALIHAGAQKIYSEERPP